METEYGNDGFPKDEVVSTVWRSGNNIGTSFKKNGEKINWQDMTLDEKRIVCENMIQMGKFFMKFYFEAKKEADKKGDEK